MTTYQPPNKRSRKSKEGPDLQNPLGAPSAAHPQTEAREISPGVWAWIVTWDDSLGRLVTEPVEKFLERPSETQWGPPVRFPFSGWSYPEKAG